MKKILIIDNYDSFTYNLFQAVAKLGGNPVVFRNDEISLESVKKEKPTHIILSPGPGHPDVPRDFGVCGEVIDVLSGTVPLLGVCLGHQGIVSRFGGNVVRAPTIMHGKTSSIRILPIERASEKGNDAHSAPPHGYPSIFVGLPNPFEAMRYHSLIAERESFPDALLVTAETLEDRLIMALQHRTHPTYGVQFHPESIGTPVGDIILKNFLHVTL
jgi:anthranilate synthase component 2